MRTSKLFLMASCAMVLELFLASCAPAVAPTPTRSTEPSAAKAPVVEAAKPAAPVTTPKPAAEQARYGGILTRITYEDPAHLDVHQVALGPLLHTLNNTYNGLARYHWEDIEKIVPDLAEKWS